MLILPFRWLSGIVIRSVQAAREGERPVPSGKGSRSVFAIPICCRQKLGLDLGLEARPRLDVPMPVTAAARRMLQSQFGHTTLGREDCPVVSYQGDVWAWGGE